MEIDVLFWYWWVAAVLMLGIEMLSPSFLFLWMAIAAFIVGVLNLIIPNMNFQIQFFIFAILAVISLFISKRYINRHPVETDHPYLNQRGLGKIGQVCYVTTAIKYGTGRIKLDDSTWQVDGEDCPIGTRVEITHSDGSSFRVRIID
jgi:membrane protein implicated in regulation of membrane protease activity